MDLQHTRIREACTALKLEAFADHYPEFASQAVAQQQTFTDFLEGLLKSELAARQARSRSVLTRLAGSRSTNDCGLVVFRSMPARLLRNTKARKDNQLNVASKIRSFS